MYEVVLTRLLSVTSWYYLAFVSISMAMFGMTAGALAVQLRASLFTEDLIRRRLAQAVFATAVSIPISLILMLAIPVELSAAVQTVFSFVALSTVIAVPFFFSGVGVCLSLTRIPFPTGRIYFTDLTGAAIGCALSLVLMRLIDAPSTIFVISALLFVSAAAYAKFAGEEVLVRRCAVCSLAMLIVAALNASTVHGIQPIWSKGAIDRRVGILAEKWNPISRVRATQPTRKSPEMWGPSPRMPRFQIEEIYVDIDGGASTVMAHFDGDLAPLDYLRYDVTGLAAQLRRGGSAAVIGVGGGRDVLTCAVNRFQRIVGIEVNSAITDLGSRRLVSFSGFDKIPGFELHNDEGRSYLTRTSEKFDLIQASLVDTAAATAAGAMTLSENALYTVDAWKIFFDHLKPGGVITFSRWFTGSERSETYRLVSVASAALLSRGVAEPRDHLMIVLCGRISTLIAGRDVFDPKDIERVKAISDEMGFDPIYLPGVSTNISELRKILSKHSLAELAAVRQESTLDYSPTFDSSPYFFNAIHLANVPALLRSGGTGANFRAMLFLLAFLLAAVVLVISTIVLPAKLWTSQQLGRPRPLAGAIAYFVAIGSGFMLVEMAMMQQLSVFLGHPVYSLVVVLGGLILFTGIGSLLSDRWPANAAWQSRLPAIAAAAVIGLYSFAVIPVIHAFTGGVLWQRVLVCLALVAPSGLLLGFCFPVGLRWMSRLGQEKNLPWMWSLNGAAGTLGSFVALVVSMDTSIGVCVLTGAACYLFAGLVIPGKTGAAPGIASVGAGAGAQPQAS